METDRKFTRLLAVGTVLAVTLGSWLANALDVNSLANPFSVVENWAKLPTERAWGAVIGVEIDPDGKSVWVLDRCGPKGCMDPIGKTISPIQKFDRCRINGLSPLQDDRPACNPGWAKMIEKKTVPCALNWLRSDKRPTLRSRIMVRFASRKKAAISGGLCSLRLSRTNYARRRLGWPRRR
jgi:hypothetical protein